MDSHLELFMMCQAFEFRHLPMAGGIYDQHPEFLKRSIYIMQEQAKEQRKQEAERERKNGSRKPRR